MLAWPAAAACLAASASFWSIDTVTSPAPDPLSPDAGAAGDRSCTTGAAAELACPSPAWPAPVAVPAAGRARAAACHSPFTPLRSKTTVSSPDPFLGTHRAVASAWAGFAVLYALSFPALGNGASASAARAAVQGRENR